MVERVKEPSRGHQLDGDTILSMEPPGTAVRTAASPGRARPSGPKLSVLFPWSYAVTVALRPSVADEAGRSLSCSWSQADSDTNHCGRWTSRCWAPVIGSALAGAVRVLLRSRGSSRPCRYSRRPRRCARLQEQGPNRAARASSGPGAGGQGWRAVIGSLAPGGGQDDGQDRGSRHQPQQPPLRQ
jgi:hypothetical protein